MNSFLVHKVIVLHITSTLASLTFFGASFKSCINAAMVMAIASVGLLNKLAATHLEYMMILCQESMSHCVSPPTHLYKHLT